MDLAVESINGIRNRQFIGKVQPQTDFMRWSNSEESPASAGRLRHRAWRVKKDPDVLMTIRDKHIDPALVADLAHMRKMLA